MNINEKFTRALELQAQGIDRREIYKMLEYQSIDAFTKMMRKFGFKYDKNQEKYVQADCNTQSNTKSNTKSHTYSSTSVKVIEKQELKTTAEQMAVLQLIEQEQETLMQMLDWYKRMSNTDGNTFIRIELPKSENTMISARSNKVVWEEFKEFAKKHSVNFKMGDLLAQALKEYMEKYKE